MNAKIKTKSKYGRQGRSVSFRTIWEHPLTELDGFGEAWKDVVVNRKLRLIWVSQ
jgi:hypothetical protein